MLQFALLIILGARPSSLDLVVKPYVQLGEQNSLVVMWHARAGSKGWSVRAENRDFAPSMRRISVQGVAPHDVARATLSGMPPGKRITYQLMQNGRSVHGGSAVVPKKQDQAFTFAALGDIGRGTPGQRKVAFELHRKRPDLIVMLGDLVYARGRMTEYRDFLYPIWAAEKASPGVGAPILANTLSIPVAGNHDTAYRDMATYPDALAYYAYWNVPLNGPATKLNIKGSQAAIDALDKAAGGKLNRMANFSFRYGNSSWVVLDSNHYVNWKAPALRKWLDEQLARSRASTWSFVAFHGPPYSSSKKHGQDTIMRSITDLISKHKVDIVFSGHVHNYQRTFPLRGGGSSPAIDRSFDGVTSTRANGTIYVISGAGGAELYDQNQPSQPHTWKPFTAKFLGGYSFTLVDVQGRKLTLRQVAADGREIDRVQLTK